MKLKLMGIDNIRGYMTAVLAVLTVAVYVDSISGSFVYDDLTVIGPHLGANWNSSTLATVFGRDFWSGLRPDKFHGGVNSIYYRPLFNFYLMLIYRIIGDHADRWHLFTVVMHTLAVLVVFRIIDHSLGSLFSIDGGRRCLLAGIAAAVFAIHPLQSESVAWISAIGNPSSTILILGVVYFYLKYLERSELKQYLLAVAVFLVAVLWKENALTLILILPAYELLWHYRHGYQPEGASREGSGITYKYNLVSRSIVRMLPFAAVAIGYFILRFIALGTLVGRYQSFNFPDDSSLTIADNLLTLPVLINRYAGMMLAPLGLSSFYTFPYVRFATIGSFWSPFVVVAFATAILAVGCRKWPELRLATLWMVLPLLPHLNTLGHSSEELIQDHYLYLPLMGYGLLAASVLGRLCLRLSPAFARRAMTTLAAILIAVLGVMTAQHNRLWQNQNLLWAEAAAHAPRSRIIHLELGELAELRNDLELAEHEYHVVLAINGEVLDGLNNLAFVEAKQNRWAEATENFEHIVLLSPEKPLAHFNLAISYSAEKRYDEAQRELQTAVDLDPSGPRALEWRRRLDNLRQRK
ncbi:MAG: hypothetical protein DMF61_04255 [Blastocatellia bacterium AA13]|nr:MAG: hypothetical protein DMF61_04255 [Blastocatellia bacterium AA13]